MELALSVMIGCIFTGGIWLLLRSNTYQIILGISLISHGVNLFVFCASGIKEKTSVVVNSEQIVGLTGYVDPLPQAVVLTSIIINFSMTALIFLIFTCIRFFLDTENVDGKDKK